MDLVTLDFESPYCTKTGYTLTKMSVEDYVCDPRFDLFMCGVTRNAVPAYLLAGPRREIIEGLRALDLHRHAVNAHNMMFDGLILERHCGIIPKLYIDTLSMARPIMGSYSKRLSLAALVKFFGLGEKGDEVIRADGKMSREMFTPYEWAEYGRYCINDTELCAALYQRMRRHSRPFALEGVAPNGEWWMDSKNVGKLIPFPDEEMRTIDATIRMYTQPKLVLNKTRLEANQVKTREKKAKILAEAEVQGVTAAVLRSTDKFATLLESMGVEVPLKPSPADIKNGKTPPRLVPAFGKTDEGFKALIEEYQEDLAVSTLLAARMSEKSTMEEKRTERLIHIAERYPRFRIPIGYCKAHTTRDGGEEGINAQNFPGAGKSEMRFAIEAPPGHVIVDADQAQIEARLVAVCAGQTNLVQQFRDGEDVYSAFASRLFGRKVDRKLVAHRTNGDKYFPDEKEGKVGKECVGPDTLVLTPRGWVPIVSVTLSDLVWDGITWVAHQGLSARGEKEVLNLAGVLATPDHEVWTGDSWAEWHVVHTNPFHFQSALNSASLPSSNGSIVIEAGAQRLDVLAAQNQSSHGITSVGEQVHDAMPAPRKLLGGNDGGNIRACVQIVPTGSDFSIESLRYSSDVRIRRIEISNTTVCAESMFTRNGEVTAARSSLISSLCPDGMIHSSNSIEKTVTGDTNPETYDSLPGGSICETGGESKTSNTVSATSKLRSPVFDLLNCGPRHRFTILTDNGPIVISNSILGLGFEMGAEKFRLTLAGRAGIKETIEVVKGYVDTYRTTYGEIPKLWGACKAALGEALMHGRWTDVGPVSIGPDGIRFPSGLPIHYPNLDWDGRRYTYQRAKDKYPKGLFGGAVTENFIQKLARDIVFAQANKITRETGYRHVLRAHDAIAHVIPEDKAEEFGKVVLEIMSEPPSWLPNVPLLAELKIGKSYGAV